MAGLSLVLAAALVTVSPSEHLAERAAIFTSPQPACDELGLADEDGEVAALDQLRDGEPLTPAGGFDNRDCELPEKAPAVVDCNDSRSNVWVHEMVGTCDMPVVRSHAWLRAPSARDRNHEPLASCEGASCARDTLPLRSATTSGHRASWLAVDAPAPPAAWPASRITPSDEREPESALARRDERPPRLRAPA